MGYLVLSLKIGQRLKIGDDIEVMVTDFDMGRADVAIQAPRELAITRLPSLAEEVFKRGDQNEHHSRSRPGKSFLRRGKD